MKNSPKNTENYSKGRLRQVFENVLYIGLAIALALLIQKFIGKPFIVNGVSMSPTMQTNEYIIIDQLTYKFTEIERGDVVVFRAPPEPGKYYIKRIIGLPGEIVKIDNGEVTIINEENPDGLKLTEDYVKYTKDTNLLYEISDDHYFVMGDNRAESFDSKDWGLLPKKEIRGRAWLRLFPLNKINYLPGKISYEQNK